MKLKKAVALATGAAVAMTMAACSSDGSGDGANYVSAWGSEPQNPLIPANTNETGGGRIVDLIYSGLVYYDADGQAHNDQAESIDLEGDKTYKIKLKEGLEFSDGTPITAQDYVDTWNAAVANSMMNAFFFEPVKGYSEGAKEMEGLKVVDDRTFTVELTQPESDFPSRLGYTAYFVMPSKSLENLDEAGENPIGSGPYKLENWSHQESATVVPNDKYQGERKAQNDGVKFVFYSSQDAAYADLLAGNLDVLDAVPDSAFSTFRDELGDRAVNQPAAVFQSFTIPQKLEHFSGEEGQLRREAISLAIDREEITKTIFQDTRTPAKDFTSPVIEGFSEDLKNADVLRFDPSKAKELWAKADAISKYDGEFTISYNADGGHQAWVDAVANQLRNNLGLNASGNPYPDFKSLRDEVTKRTIKGAFRSGWQADYPSIGNFLTPLYATNASSNDGDYSNPEFDAKLKKAAEQKSVEDGIKEYQSAEEILFRDLPAIPLWYSNITGGSSDQVDNVTFGWNSLPRYSEVTKK
ncbi:peptide ABC transporter substrate-binding protein [Corynebacterium gerontici]|uniref:Dipeptide-binding protein DppE n=1 Tax=Corynebacterium gerontici TaxID=2079234 RepID=A0A3G6IZC1_9CORY|nr:ABC transporter substrate-binding protein [Corynebacterium gerontici]AZA11139.1 Dipeptide-binding protein DppE precursor [Corynebacterium gerontici]